MTSRVERYDRLAELFAYPGEGYVERLSGSVAALEDGYGAVADLLRRLFEHVRELSVEQLQELYTRTFDINPVCTLEIGWHIYGEDYARGELLVKLRERLRAANLPESAELPDHLVHVLPLLGRISGDDADALAGRYLRPALRTMLEGMRDGEHPYRALLEAVDRVVATDHDVAVARARERRADPPDWNNRLPVFGRETACGPCAGPGERSGRS